MFAVSSLPHVMLALAVYSERNGLLLILTSKIVKNKKTAYQCARGPK